MDDSSMKRLRAAVASAWWVILIMAIWMLVGWIGYLYIMENRPEFVQKMWGGGPLTWGQVQTIYLWVFAVLKMVLMIAVMIALWLTFYMRRLKRGD